MIFLRQWLFLLFLIFTCTLQAQKSNGTWEGNIEIDGKKHKITVIIQAIDSTKNKNRYVYKYINGGMILERNGEEQSFAMGGSVNEDHSVNMGQPKSARTEYGDCLWVLSLGYFKGNLLMGELVGKGSRQKTCRPGRLVRLKKVVPKA